jgi:GNAT superfamily N-acetyltransferase
MKYIKGEIMHPDIRLLQSNDLYSVKELAKLIWDGDDYLGKIAKAWIEDGGFLGMFEGEKLIGCAKITRLPDKVIWLEGLRIHPDYQHKGLGRQLSGIALDTSLQFVKTGEADFIEFSTYYKNEDSIHLATEAGFKKIDEYYILSHKAVKPSSSDYHARIHDNVTDYFPKSLPFGWKFLHPSKPALSWLNKKAHLCRAEGGYFYICGEQPTVCLLSPAGEWITKAMPVMQYFLGKKQPLEVMLHSSRKADIEVLLSLDFHWWEEDTEDIVQVFRYQPE